MQKIFNFFPLSIYKSVISLPENEKQEMIKEIYLMEKNSQNLEYKSKGSAWTGDTQGFEFLHDNSKFKNLFNQIYKNTLEYLENLSINYKKLDLYFQRSWATISRGHDNISNHRHSQSHISFAYYLSKKKNDSKITFWDQNKHNEIIPNLFDSKTVVKKGILKKRDVLNSAKIIFDTKEDEIVIFPSKTLHGTENVASNSERISISADIIIVAKDSNNLEHLMTPLKKWKLFSN
jgi:uncharacterized protein (TIGR02466 family)